MKATPVSPARLPRRRLIAVTLAVALLGITTMAAAVVVSNPGPLTGCLASKTNKAMATTQGVIYNVAIGATPAKPCLTGDTQVVFSNAAGPQGDPGEDGDDGADGAPGIQGPAGPLNTELVTWTFSTASGEVDSTTVFEPGAILTFVSWNVVFDADTTPCDIGRFQIFPVDNQSPDLASIDFDAGATGSTTPDTTTVYTIADFPSVVMHARIACTDGNLNFYVIPFHGSITFTWQHLPTQIP